MIALFLIPLWLGASQPAPRAVAPMVPAQVSATASARTDTAIARVKRVRGEVKKLTAAENAAKTQYDRDVREVEVLRRGRPSWNRDRKLRAARSKAHASGQVVARAESKRRAATAQLVAARKDALALVAAELSTPVAKERQAFLLDAQRGLSRALSSSARPIRVPDLNIDELADPDELLEQLALIKKAEQRLSGEAQSLDARAKKYQRIASLRGQRRRDAELGAFTGDDIRRTTGRVRGPADVSRDAGGNGSPGSVEAQGAPAGDAPPGAPSGGGTGGNPTDTDPVPQTPTESFQSLAVILADVIDDSAEEALKRASRTLNAETRAEAAARAKSQVQEQLRVLRAKRAAIEARVKKLSE